MLSPRSTPHPDASGPDVTITPEVTAHSIRFRKISNRYPRRVSEAYGGDIARAALDDDETVAGTVRAWEISQGLEPRDWLPIGRSEGRG